MISRTISRRALMRWALGSAAILQSTSWRGLAQAAARGQLRIGMAAPPTTLDPHLKSNAPNNALATHIYDTLVTNDEKSVSRPGLAAAWRVIDDTHWEFELRPDVRFSDGEPLTVDDITVSFDRANTIESTASFRTYTRNIKSITSPQAGKLVIETKQPEPLLSNSLSRIRIIRAKFKDATSDQFNNGTASIGTGPYVLKEYVPGNRVALSANPNYWGAKPALPEVELRIVTDAGARLANLLAGDLDLVEQVPYEGIARVEKDERFHVVRGVSSRVVFFSLDTFRDVSPFITDKDGKPLDRNPLKDLRVRRALSMAIDRKAIVERLMQGNAVVASQFLPVGAPGTSAAIKPIPFDAQNAKALLAEAGYPDGFGLTIHGPNDRIVNDSKIVQVVAQMLTRIGLKVSVDVMPWSVYADKADAHTFSFNLDSWGVNTGETSNPLTALIATQNSDAGLGIANSGRYSNPDVDAKLAVAKRTLDDAKREKMLSEISDIVFNDVALIPMHHEVLVVAARKDIQFMTRADQYTLAMNAKTA
ncbi:ABC transporter substrate-binding protein [Mesorhizobium sp. M0965]|uniref:ABC transporter substrate-binding protein n=1 Tax=Mesorhizobium sp. M0965 TaxID=2957036 RepID=UPI00333840B1